MSVCAFLHAPPLQRPKKPLFSTSSVTMVQVFCRSQRELIFYSRIQFLIGSAAIRTCAFLYDEIIFLYQIVLFCGLKTAEKQIKKH